MIDKATDVIVGEEELALLLIGILERYGYDFSAYSKASLKRRVSRFIMLDKLSGLTELLSKVLEDEDYFNRFLEEITVNVTEMFRDPLFFKTLREKVFPHLSVYPLIRIWHAGCSTGEEVYSMAILLREAGLLERSLIYATDINQQVLEKAKKAKYTIDQIKRYTQNYIESGGKKDFSNYYTIKYGKALFDLDFQKHIVFSIHNLVADQSFNEFNLIVCRNVLIYFNSELQNKVIGLFYDSLPKLGVLALGSKESIGFTDHNQDFISFDSQQKIWEKVK